MIMKTQQLKTYGMQQKQSREKFIVIQSYFMKQEKHRIDSLTLHLKQLEKEEEEQQQQQNKKAPKLVEGKKS